MRVLAVLALVLLGHHSESSIFPLQLQTFTLEELIPFKAEFFPERYNVEWTSDNEYTFSEPRLGISKYNAATKSISSVLDAAELDNLKKYTVSSFSTDGKYLLLATNRRKVYRYSTIAEYFIYDLQNKSIQSLAEGPLQVVVWGNGPSLAYVKDNNVLYVPDCSRPEITSSLTSQGVPGEVYFGVADWIYEEEVLSASEALWFSPSGTYLAVASFNDTEVESTVYPFYGYPGDYNFQYPHEIRFKYPKAGRANPIVGLQVFKPDDPDTDAWNIPAPADVIGSDHILARVNWASDQNLLVLWMNRRQSISILMSCDLIHDKCSVVKERNESNGWIDIGDPKFNSRGTQMVEIEPLYFGGRRLLHVAQFDFTTQLTEDLTPINATVTEILAWNSEKEILLYIASPENIPWQRQLWASQNGQQRCISCKEPACHYVTAMISPGCSYGVISCTASNIPSKTFLYNTQEDSFKLIKDNARLVNTLSRYKLPMVLFNKISLGANVMAHIKLLLPPEVKKDQKYPMVLRVYSGPGTTRVTDTYDLEYYNWYLASNRSFIVASIDVRGSGVMGVDALHAVNKALGTVEVTDTLAAVRKLLSLYSFIDPKRIGVWGWSYGGYATTMMLVKDDQNLITCGAAVAPVTSWLYYDSIYTERYMDTPQMNPLGYQRSDLLGSAEKLRGRKYLLIHGTGDDNVHFQHSLQLAKVLQHSDIAFEQMSYTDETHSLPGVSRHFYHTLDRFWTECFYS